MGGYVVAGFEVADEAEFLIWKIGDVLPPEGTAGVGCEKMSVGAVAFEFFERSECAVVALEHFLEGDLLGHNPHPALSRCTGRGECYIISRILNSIVPRGALTRMVSPMRAFMSASPMGLF